MENQFFERPILNSPYAYPSRHWELDDAGQPTQQIVATRRSAKFITPIPRPRKRTGSGEQASLALDEGTGVSGDAQQYAHTAVINAVRQQVDQWRRLPHPADWRVTPETARLLQHWRHHNFSGVRPFFCQDEAVETAIWLTEVAPQAGKSAAGFLEHLANASANANPELMRLALKLATGAGKTTVMAMLIAWQTINAVRHPGSKRFTRGFLIVAPGITIRDRLRVLQPNDPNSYYKSRELVPADMQDDLHKAKIVLTNYHAFKLRERVDLSKGGKAVAARAQRRAAADAGNARPDAAAGDARVDGHERRDGAQRRGAPLLSRKAWHRRRRGSQGRGEKRGREKRRGSAPVDFRPGSGQPQRGRVAGHGSLRHAVFPQRLRLRRGHPVSLDHERFLANGRYRVRHRQAASRAGGREHPRQRNADVPRAVEAHRQEDAQKRPRQERHARSAEHSDGAANRAFCAVRPLQKTHALWQQSGIRVPPCFIVVCNNTATSKLVYDYISGFIRENENGTSQLVHGALKLFRNYDEYDQPLPRPNTLLIDSEQLESGGALDKSFRDMAGPEIDLFKREALERGGALANDIHSGKGIDDATLLREVMNTVGKPGALGESIRCVVSVSMLTEGWDANTVTHVLGVRAFGTQLLCEQVIGRALRRQSYELNEEGLFNVEYADVLGIPFDFTAKPVIAKPQAPRETVQVKAVLPEREALQIEFPRVAGYRVELPQERLEARFDVDSILELTPALVGPSQTQNAGIIGESVNLGLEHLGSLRRSTLLFHLTQRLITTHWRDPGQEPPLHLFGQLKRNTKQWLDTCLVCKGDTYPGLLMYQSLADMACNRITAAITKVEHEKKRPIKAVLDPYNPTGSTRHVNFNTSKLERWETLGPPPKCPLNWVILDSDWEAEFCRVAEAHPRVLAYVKNHNLGLEVPYRYGSETRQYRPDFVIHVDDGCGAEDPLNLIVEIKGYRGEDAKDKKLTMDTYWVPGVNHLGSYGRWAFTEFTDVFQIQQDFAKKVEAQFNTMIKSVAVQAGPTT